MKTDQKEAYVQPVLVKHELLRDITAGGSGNGNGVRKQWWGPGAT